MPTTKAEQKAVNEYKRKNYKRIAFEMRIEEYEAFKATCDSMRIPVNTFIREAIRVHLKEVAESAERAENGFM